MDLESVRLMLDYHFWATQRVLGALRVLTLEQFTRPLISSFPSIQATVVHLISAEAVWITRMLGEQIALPTPADIPSPEAAAERWAITQGMLRSMVEPGKETDLNRVVQVKHRSGAEYHDSVWGILIQLSSHGTYHRGQLTTLLRQVGADPVQTDLIMYLRENSIT